MAEDAKIEGKTKIIFPDPDVPGEGDVHQKEDITAGDGVKHDILPGKGELANETTCNVFELLAAKGVPLAFIERRGDHFRTKLCEMIPVEVVVRNKGVGSYCARHPDFAEGTAFDSPVVEFFYKTTDRDFFGVALPCDDPLMIFADDGATITLHHPKREVEPDAPLLRVSQEQMSMADRRRLYAQLQCCRKLALRMNKELKEAFAFVGGEFIDVKFEFGVLSDGTIVGADVVDCDSWRTLYRGVQLSKQGYRDGDDLEQVGKIYKLAARLTRKFKQLH